MMNIYLAELSATYPDNNLLLIMDQAGWHKSKDLEMPANISIEYLPAYSPELNPVEKLWQWLRRHVCRNRTFEDEQDIENALVDELNQLRQSRLATLCACSYL